MPSYHVQYVDGYGPYLRKAEWVGEPEGHEWEHIGPLHSVDPAQIPDDVVERVRGEGYGLARYRDNIEADVMDLAVANGTRDALIAEHGDDVLAPDDDRRETTIRLAEDAPPDAARELGGTASEMRAEVQTIGQAELTDDEIDAIDFTRDNASIPHAQAAKAALTDAGVSNWTDHYEPETHPEPHGHTEDMEKSKKRAAELGLSGPGDKRLDEDDSDLENAHSRAKRYESRVTGEAEEAYADGDDSAGEFLRNEFDYDESDLAALRSGAQEAAA